MIARPVTPLTPLDLAGWLEMLSLMGHWMSECVGVTLGGHKVSPTSNYTVTQPHHSPERKHRRSVVDCLLACLTYTVTSYTGI